MVFLKLFLLRAMMQNEETLLWPGLGQGQRTQARTDVDKPYSVWLPLPLLSSLGTQVTELALSRALGHGAMSFSRVSQQNGLHTLPHTCLCPQGTQVSLYEWHFEMRLQGTGAPLPQLHHDTACDLHWVLSRLCMLLSCSVSSRLRINCLPRSL